MKKHANLSIFVPHNGCPRQCVFCNQNRISGESHTPSPSEVAELCERFLPEQDISGHTEIAFFGGSFTAIDRCIQEPLLNTAYSFVKKGRASGIRLSTRPDAIDSEILRMLDCYCAHSIELGAQSMDDSVLELNRRGHTSQAVIDACALIKSSEA
ncbi:MAG: radical SAM protein, partial [Oscillospiraceae bacterium]